MITARTRDLMAIPLPTGGIAVQAKLESDEGDRAVTVQITTAHAGWVALLRDSFENDRAIQATLSNRRGA